MRWKTRYKQYTRSASGEHTIDLVHALLSASGIGLTHHSPLCSRLGQILACLGGRFLCLLQPPCSVPTCPREHMAETKKRGHRIILKQEEDMCTALHRGASVFCAHRIIGFRVLTLGSSAIPGPTQPCVAVEKRKVREGRVKEERRERGRDHDTKNLRRLAQNRGARYPLARITI